MPRSGDLLSIGEAAKRAGVAPSALRFYESRGLIQSSRGAGGQRRFKRSMLRQISLIRIAQSLGISLREISEALDNLPQTGTTTQADWELLASKWRKQLDERIRQLSILRERLDGCIGCGCLSLKACSLYNPDDQARRLGVGPRYIISDER